MFGRPRKRLWRWTRRVLFTLATLVILVVVLLVSALHNLDRPFLKTRVQSLAKRYGGVDVDYGDIRVGVWSGVVVDELVVRSAPAFRSIAPELARVKALSVSWDIAVFRAAVRLQKVTASGISVTVASNEQGQMSFDGLGPPPSEKPSPPSTPLSKQPASLLASPLPSIDVGDVSLTMIRPGDERTSLRGVELHLQPEGTSRVTAQVGAPTAPLVLDVTRDRAGVPTGEAHAKLWLTLDGTAHDVLVALDVEVMKQSLVEHVDVARLVHAEVHAHFDDAAHQTTVTIEKTDVAAGTATVSAALELPDHGAPLVRHVEGRVDAPRLLTLMPEGLVPLRALLKRGDVSFRADALSLDELPRLNEGANVVIDADLDDVRIVQPIVVDVAKGKLAARIEPSGKGLKAHATLTASGAKMPGAASADGVALEADLTQSETGAIAGTASLAFEALEAAQVSAKDGKIGLKLAGVVVDPVTLLESRGDVAVTADIAKVALSGASVDQLALTALTRSNGQAPYALDATVSAARVRAAGIVDTPLHVAARIEGVTPDPQILRTPGIAHATIDAAESHIVVAANKTTDAVDYTLDVKATSLGALKPFINGPPLERMAATVASHGTLTGLGSSAPSFAEQTELRIDNPSYDQVSARAVLVKADSKGNAIHHELHGELRVEALAAAGTPPTNDEVSFGASFDREAQTVSVHADGTGRASTKLAAKLAFDRARRAITYDVDVTAAKLAPLAPLVAHLRGLDGFDLSQLEVGLSGKGAVLGVVKAFDASGVVLEPAPLKTFAADGTVNAKLVHLAYSAGSTSFSAPSVRLGVVLHPGPGEQRVAETHLELGEFHLAAGPHAYEFGGVEDRTTLTATGDLRDPELEMEQRATVQVVKQDIAPMVPMGQALLSVSVRRTRDGVLHIAKLEIANGAGATQAKLSGALDPSELQKRLSLHGDVRQDLSRLSIVPSRFAARGTANVAVRVESPDLTIFRTVADVKVENASIWLPAYGIVVEEADGEIPITVSARLTPRGLRVIRDERENPYSSLRFADQHPLLRRSSFIKIRRLTLPQAQIAPLVGNLAIDQNLISLQQFEIGVRNGRVTGQVAFDWNGAKSTVAMHVRADHVESSHGEPFTGNAALFLSAGEHSIEGRADILQIGERHLLDLLDLQDPFHADAGMNKIRGALRFGYPDRVRLTFNHGFASAHVQLGGLARFISIGDLKGIPMGPIIDQVITPFLPAKEDP